MIGKTLGNRYYLLEKVGVGGMAMVFKAKDTILNRFVAVKLLKDQYMEDDDFLKKFAIEAQSAASITHANIVSVYDVGSSYIDNKKYNYIVMEYVEGCTLKELINKEAPFDTRRIIDYSSQIAAALECAHKNKIIHRDIKPQNMLICDDCLKVTDFGIARIASTSTITYTSTVLGTVHYISPEQAKGKFIDEKSDIYSLGVVMYEMATGRVPYDASNAVGIALKHIQDDLIPPIEYNENLPSGLNNIICKALEKDPQNRFKTAREFITALKQFENYNYVIDSGETAKINSIPEKETWEKLSSREQRRDQIQSIYEMDNVNEREVEKKGSFFLRYVFPVLLALLVLIGFLYAKSKLDSNDKKEDDQISVPAVIGLEENVAKRILEDQGFKVDVKQVENADIKQGLVIKQEPVQNSVLKKGQTVMLEISTGEKLIDVPNLKDLTLDNARLELKKFGLEVGEISEDYNDGIEEGRIIDQQPAFGQQISAKQKVNLTVSKGKENKNVAMVNLINLDVTKATDQIEKIGLNVGHIDREFSDTIAENKVIWQQYREGTQVEKGKTVDLIVSKGKKNDDNNTDSDNNQNTAQKKKFNFEIIQPVQEGEYKLTIKKILKDGSEKVVYEKEHQASDGDVRLTITDDVNAKFHVYINDKLQVTN